MVIFPLKMVIFPLKIVIFHSFVNVYQAGYPQPTHNHPAPAPGCTLLTLEVLFNAPAIAMAMSPAFKNGRMKW